VFAGAEKLQETTRQTWSDKFGVRVFEGYGATETSPALSTNTAMDNRNGTVGRLLPGIEYHLDKVDGVEDGGRLSVKGPNVMLGYLLYENSINGGNIIVAPKTELGDGWYDTGDIVNIDDDGFIIILGRAKRFLKISGEIIFLSAIEIFLSINWPNKNHAVIAIPDDRKGEKLVLLTEEKELTRKLISERYKEQGMNELSIPRILHFIKKIPLLGTGKSDYVAINKIVTDKI